MVPSIQHKRRRRRRPLTRSSNIATKTIFICALIFSSQKMVNGNTATSNTDDPPSSTNTISHHHHINHQETISRWRALQSSSEGSYDLTDIQPYDLVLDEHDNNKRSPRVYKKGRSGTLTPYNTHGDDSMEEQLQHVGRLDLRQFSKNSKAAAESRIVAGGGVTKPIGKSTRPAFQTMDNTVAEDHNSAARLGMTNFDHDRGIGLEDSTNNEEDEEEGAVERRRTAEEEKDGRRRSLRGLGESGGNEVSNAAVLLFPYTEETDPWEQTDYIVMNNGIMGRRLETNSAEGFVNSYNTHDKSSQEKEEEEEESETAKEKGGTSSKTPYPKNASNVPPVIHSRFPPADIEFAHTQSFGAIVFDPDDNLDSVCVQLQDSARSRSPCFELLHVGTKPGGRRRRKLGLRRSKGSSANKKMMELRLNCNKAKNKDHPRCNKDDAEDNTDTGTPTSSPVTDTPTSSPVTDTPTSPPVGIANIEVEEQEEQEIALIYELMLEGFEEYAGDTWKWRIRTMDVDKNRISSPWRKITISPTLGVMPPEETTTTTTTTSSTLASFAVSTGATVQTTSKATTTTTTSNTEEIEYVPPAPTKLMEEVKDEDWPHGGIIKTSTGRILFFFDNHPFVCSGTVLEDPLHDRTIILTAGHCAYQYRDIGGRFAEHALFIPNQSDTRGDKSDELCSNDPLGCWSTAFAVVDYEWTTKNFPQSVPYDYAMYVIPNDPAAHEGGFIHEGQPELSKILEEILEPIPIDFNWELPLSSIHMDVPGEFTHGLGYSFDKDPAFRYCAGEMSTKFGISTYENLWLGVCEMTGGSSGGPWLKDTDTDGRGTVVSINSWGYASSGGMAGPNFNTAMGSKVECLYEVAKTTSFESMIGQRGIVTDC